MFIYLSKKIAIPNNIKLHSLSWNPDQGWIACGGESGLLKVLKLETTASRDGKTRGVAAPSNLSMNQTLEGHNGAVMCVTWNANYRKLTTSDEKGLIIVWMLHKGMWYEEMINNRNKSVVKDMGWNADGSKICIVYEDGAVIVGSVDGNRIWGKEFDHSLSHVEWSPDSRYIIFVNGDDGKINVYDALGVKIRPLNLYALEDLPEDKIKQGIELAGMHWYDGSEGYADPNAPTLAIAFRNGRVQVTRGDEDEDPILIDTKMKLSQCKWNVNGTVLALAGTQSSKSSSGDRKEFSMVQFYDPYGNHLRTLKVPGAGIGALSWEGSGLRIALAVDAYIYFANIRPDHKWAYFANTVVYAYNRTERSEQCIQFWELGSGTKNSTYVRALKHIRASGDHCILVSGPVEESSQQQQTPEGESGGTGGEKGRSEDGPRYQLMLCNAIGSPVDTKYVSILPVHVAMTSTHVVVADGRNVYVWQYRYASQTSTTSSSSSSSSSASSSTTAGKTSSANSDGEGGGGGGGGGAGGGGASGGTGGGSSLSASLAVALRHKAGKERFLDIEDKSNNPGKLLDSYKIQASPSKDAITAICGSEKLLVVSRQSGTIQAYSLPHIGPENTYSVRCRPGLLRLNCNSTKLAVVDVNGMMSLLDLEGRDDDENSDGSGGGSGSGSSSRRKTSGPGKMLGLERKDTWDVIWAEDNPNLFASMEKTRLFTYNNLKPEDPVLTSGYLAKFNNLKVKTILVDEIMAEPEDPDKDLAVVEYETKSLRDARDLVGSGGLEEAYAYVEANPHPRLSRLLAEAALEQLNFNVGEKAFAKCSTEDYQYQGMQFVKRLRTIQDPQKQKAEVATYFERFDEAESIYKDIDRKDLAIDLRQRLGDWFRVVQLVQSGVGGDDELLSSSYDHIGDYYADRFRWAKAAHFYSMSKNMEKMADCYYRLEDYDKLASITNMLPQGSPQLVDLGRKFEGVGMHKEATECYLKIGDIKSAIDCCVVLNQWDVAVDLAEKHNFPQIEGLLAKYATVLLQSGQRLQAVELYRRANKATEAARLLARIADDVGKMQVDPLLAKKLLVLAALEVERFRRRAMDMTSVAGGRTAAEIAQTTAATLDTLMTAADEGMGAGGAGGGTSAKVLDTAWRGAEAYHFYLLAQRQLYNGDTEAAMKTSIRLAEYEDILDPRDIYSLIALASYLSKYYGVCSRAFIKLETLSSAPRDSILAGGNVSTSSVAATKRVAATMAGVGDLASKDGGGGMIIAGLRADEYADAIQTLALSIFIRHPPQDPQQLPQEMVNCLETGEPYKACTATGELIMNSKVRTIICHTCRHHANEHAMRGVLNCPLCHTELK